MITFKVITTGAIGRLEGQQFAVPDDPQTETILNNLVFLHPIITTGHPDPDYELFEHIHQQLPVMELVSRDKPPLRLPGRIY